MSKRDLYEIKNQSESLRMSIKFGITSALYNYYVEWEKSRCKIYTEEGKDSICSISLFCEDDCIYPFSFKTTDDTLQKKLTNLRNNILN